MPSEDAPNDLNVDQDQVHVVVTTIELDMIVDALRSVGNIELADRLATILHQLLDKPTRREPPSIERPAQSL